MTFICRIFKMTTVVIFVSLIVTTLLEFIQNIIINNKINKHF
nr:MAG TPA: hypothetical protein [Caudoviricetes sp.]